MIKFPIPLITSLTELGLLESEAKIYAALVLLRSAEVKDLLEFLDTSKPRIYDGLRMLEETGIIIQTSPRPATYQAITPPVALQLLMKKHEKAKNEALKQLKILEEREIIKKSSSPLWFIFGVKSFEFKIKDMIENAQESIYCQTSGKYLNLITKAVKKGVKTYLVIINDEDQDIHEYIEDLSKKSNVKISLIKKNQFMKTLGMFNEESQPQTQSIDDIMKMFDLNNQFALVVDDSEILAIPPLKSEDLNAITSTNKAMVYSTKIAIKERILLDII